eukprot:1495826-Karenia_brevis.AAC.1
MDRGITKASASDNFIGYANEFIISEKLNFLEAAIACTIFTGLITYYMEDPKDVKHRWKGNRHLPENALGQP